MNICKKTVARATFVDQLDRTKGCEVHNTALKKVPCGARLLIIVKEKQEIVITLDNHTHPEMPANRATLALKEAIQKEATGQFGRASNEIKQLRFDQINNGEHQAMDKMFPRQIRQSLKRLRARYRKTKRDSKRHWLGCVRNNQISCKES